MEKRLNTPRAAYPEPLDAIVLAGTHQNPNRLILGRNKAFLEIGGKALVRRVVDALLASKAVGQVFVVGPIQELRPVLDGISARISLVPQEGKMMKNAWAAVYASEAFQREHGRPDDPTRPLLAVSCDLPLLTTEAVDDFVARCAAIDRESNTGYAILCGVSEEASLRQYYPEDGKPGIQRPYVNFSDCRVRLANIYVGRPRTLANQAFLQTGFEHRKAEKLKNVLALVWDFLSQKGGWQAAWMSLRMQATLMAERSGSRFYEKLRAGNSARRTEEICSEVLGGPVRIVISPFGGLSLDADNVEDFRILSARFEEWIHVPPVES